MKNLDRVQKMLNFGVSKPWVGGGGRSPAPLDPHLIME